MVEFTRSEPGFALRLRREAQRVASQHAQLDLFQGVVQDALQRGDLAEAERTLARFCEALDAHFSLEEEFYFPAVHSHDSELGAQLSELALEHESLRTGCSEATFALSRGDAAACEAMLDALLPRLDAHERREEALLPLPAPNAV